MWIYCISDKLIIIKIKPIIKKIILFCFSLYFNDAGNNWHIDICVIIPAIMAKVQPIILSVIIGFKKKNAKTAPKGSAKAEINVHPIAFFLLPVAL